MHTVLEFAGNEDFRATFSQRQALHASDNGIRVVPVSLQVREHSDIDRGHHAVLSVRMSPRLFLECRLQEWIPNHETGEALHPLYPGMLRDPSLIRG